MGTLYIYVTRKSCMVENMSEDEGYSVKHNVHNNEA